MVTVEDFSRLVSGIYAAALAPQHWVPALCDVMGTLDGTGTGLVTSDGSSRWQLAALAPEAEKSYAEHYSRLDHVLAAVEKGPVGTVRTGSELILPYQNTEFYSDWIRPNELEDGLFVRLNSGTTTSCFVVASPRRSESFDTPGRVKLFCRLVPHLQQALRMQDKFTALTRRTTGLLAALEAVRHAIIIVGSGCWVVHLNAAAERIVRAGDGLEVRSGRIVTGDTHTEKRLQGALHAALDQGADVRRGRSFTCERPSGKRPYVVQVLPLQSPPDETLPATSALVLVIDQENESQPPAALVRQLYGLTNTEARIALLVAHGADLKQIADELGISLATVRTHLKHIFDKTDTHRQAELVGSLLALSR